jgi:hypothetical protein
MILTNTKYRRQGTEEKVFEEQEKFARNDPTKEGINPISQYSGCEEQVILLF